MQGALVARSWAERTDCMESRAYPLDLEQLWVAQARKDDLAGNSGATWRALEPIPPRAWTAGRNQGPFAIPWRPAAPHTNVGRKQPSPCSKAWAVARTAAERA